MNEERDFSRENARAGDKKAAIKAIIETDFADQDAVQRLVDASGYFAP